MSTQHVRAVSVTVFSTGGKFRPVSNFTGFPTLTQATCSYTLLLCTMVTLIQYTKCICTCSCSVYSLCLTLVLGREDNNGLTIPPPDHASATCRPLTHIKASSPLMDVGTLRTGSLQSVAALIESWFNDNIIRSYKSCSPICIWFQLLHTCYCVCNIATEYSCNDMSIYNYITIVHKCTCNKSA